MLRSCVALACLALACGSSSPRISMPHAASPSPSPLAADAIAGVTDPALRSLIADHWEYLMKWAPTWATTLGDHRYDDRLAPRDPAAIAEANGERDALLVRTRAIDPATVGAADRITLAMLRGKLEAEHGMDACKFHEWTVDSG